ncbi:hypothetical protein BCR32DRAFT_274109 [Anaeromyces robustus]|uniref:EGF-like domain-containing protein n=1 Tax=Anaeromyces robustus TaxID=1754192 RepID=A0A1Y1XQ62_9FUNG|nr:hypothetical protein BCR32DRAFT_274109 [Anaeromyces robustus]|eukprot:ORX87900.1 hypothetical protein BCR32DRAFT_274109 [Anaeromyces robustus]
MKIYIKNIYLFYLFVLLITEFTKSKNLYITNNNENVDGLYDSIASFHDESELKIYFSEIYYKMPNKSENTISMNNNIYFIGNSNMTTFDFINSKEAGLNISFRGLKEWTLSYENIIFKNYENINNGLNLFFIETETEKYQILFTNCIFEDIDYIMRLKFNCKKKNENKINIIFTNCVFRNINKEILFTYFDNNYKVNCNSIQFNNCKFYKNRANIYPTRGDTEFNNCIFSDMDSEPNTENKTAFIYSSIHSLSKNYFNNCIFRNINYKGIIPLIHISNSKTIFKNVTFEHCFSGSGYLIESFENLGDSYIKFDNVSVIDSNSIIRGKEGVLYVENSEFKNITIKNSLPGITDYSYKSKLYFDNVKIKNINLNGKGLFDDESIYFFNNIVIKNVTTNSKYLISSSYNLTINNSKISDIICKGDQSDSSFIYFNSYDTTSSLNISNTIISNSYSNGPFIRVNGDINKINFENLKVSNISSYGQLIENNSLNSSIAINNSEFVNNNNFNKLSCGNIYIVNDLELFINNSIFNNNTVRKNGGVLCIYGNDNIKININSSMFHNNKSNNGGAFYIMSKTVDGNSNDNSKMDSLSQFINLNNCTFKYNYAHYFGGAIYSSLKYFSLRNCKFEYNEANVAGGILFLENNKYNDTIIEETKVDKIDNKASSYGADYATFPYQIILDNIRDIIKVKSGEIINMNFKILDNFNSVVEDKINYFFDLSFNIIIKSKETDDYLVEGIDYLIDGNRGSFNNGIFNSEKLRIYSKNYHYVLEFNINLIKYQDIVFKPNKVDIEISECNDEDITIYKNEYNIPYCETPICNCVENEHTLCIKGENVVNINSEKLNQCICTKGYKGVECKEEKYYDTTNIIMILKPMFISCIAIDTIVTIIIIFNKTSRIIKDTGLYSSLIFSIGIILVLIGSLFYIRFTTFGCFMHSFLTHYGFLLIYSQFVYKFIISLQYGIRQDNPRHQLKLQFILVRSKPIINYLLKNVSSSITEYNSGLYTSNENICSRSCNISIVKLFNEVNNDFTANIMNESLAIPKDDQINFVSSFIYENLNNSFEFFSIEKANITNSFTELKEYVKRTKTDYYQKYFLRVCNVFFFNILLLIYGISVYIINSIYIRDITLGKELVDDEFIPNCDNGQTDIFVLTIENIMVIWLLYKQKPIFKYSLVLKEIRYLSITVYLWVFIGPLVDVII